MTTYTTGRGPHRSEPTASASLAAPASGVMAAPTGPDPVGMISLQLVDRDRPEPGAPSKPFRELTVGVRYPARDVERYERTPGTFTHEDAPPALDPSGPRPVVLHSPGVGEARSPRVPLAEEVASHGYVVVTIEHADDARAAEFPQDRVADVRFVLDQLVSLAPGVLDLSRIGLFGRSAGCPADLAALHDDPRIKAVADLDGNLAAASTDDPAPGAPLVAFLDRRLRGREEAAFPATAARAGR
ncbi:hypothetical protein [Streptomyces sp. ME19-01-6]|uniref:poly(ethylene terephthalate) hydrolase family protein n=1 Tax=Streptomyces sp. ME19-01-6 TaxID=3028686 RepID=UPI0029B39C30|nr:hypothetical protein [Streptomyces sp. ME19-01-6]MDX3227514.1 hypothetical protein [Streptomyces sp. ME19-01-6]